MGRHIRFISAILALLIALSATPSLTVNASEDVDSYDEGEEIASFEDDEPVFMDEEFPPIAEVTPTPELTPAEDRIKYEITEELFPDEVFRDYILTNFDYTGDGFLSDEEIYYARLINFVSSKPSSLEGLAIFTNLNTFYLEGADIEALDLSSNPNIDTVVCSNNNLTEINLTGLTGLRTLIVDGNNLSGLDLHTNTALQIISAADNNLTGIDLTGINNLLTLNLSGNNIESFDLSSLGTIQDLDLSDNGLTSIDLSNLNVLQYLKVTGNRLNQLDVSGNSGLVSIRAAHNNLTSIDVTNCRSLLALDVSYNPIRSLNISNNTGIRYLYIQATDINAIDVNYLTYMKYVTGNLYEDLPYDDNPGETYKLNYYLQSDNPSPVMELGLDNDTVIIYDSDVRLAWLDTEDNSYINTDHISLSFTSDTNYSYRYAVSTNGETIYTSALLDMVEAGNLYEGVMPLSEDIISSHFVNKYFGTDGILTTGRYTYDVYVYDLEGNVVYTFTSTCDVSKLSAPASISSLNCRLISTNSLTTDGSLFLMNSASIEGVISINKPKLVSFNVFYNGTFVYGSVGDYAVGPGLGDNWADNYFEFRFDSSCDFLDMGSGPIFDSEGLLLTGEYKIKLMDENSRTLIELVFTVVNTEGDNGFWTNWAMSEMYSMVDGHAVFNSPSVLQIELNSTSDFSAYYVLKHNSSEVMRSDLLTSEDNSLEVGFVNLYTAFDDGEYVIEFYDDSDELLASRAFSVGTSVRLPEATPTVTLTPTPTMEPLEDGGVEDFVRRLYSEVLSREADSFGVSFWLDEIYRGMSGADVARMFLMSEEMANKNLTDDEFVTTLYRVFFNRMADEDGLLYWTDAMGDGLTKLQVIDAFIDSTEWANVCLTYGIDSGSNHVPDIVVSTSDDAIRFVTRLYENCLGRNPDSALQMWAGELSNRRLSATFMAEMFFFGYEFKDAGYSNEEFVMRLYGTMLGRSADPDGLMFWTGLLEDGAEREELFGIFAGTYEWGYLCRVAGMRVS